MSRRIRATDINPAVLAAAGASAGTEKLSKAKQIAQTFADQLSARGIATPEREYLFADRIARRWRFDFAWPDKLIAVEIEGLVVRRVDGHLQVLGRHASITGFKDDCEKYAWAAVFGWRVLRFEQSQVKARFAADMVVRVMDAPQAKPLLRQVPAQASMLLDMPTVSSPPPF